MIRMSGLAAILGGVVWAMCSVKLMFVQWGEPGSYLYENYEFYNRLLALSLPFLMVGSVGLHASQERRYGWPGRLGFGLTFAGFALMFVGAVGEFWLFTDQPYAEGNGREVSWTVFLLGALTLAGGSAVFGLATLKAGMLPRPGAALLMIWFPAGILSGILSGILADSTGLLSADLAFSLVMAVTLGTGWVLLGFALWSGGRDAARRPAPAESMEVET